MVTKTENSNSFDCFLYKIILKIISYFKLRYLLLTWTMSGSLALKGARKGNTEAEFNLMQLNGAETQTSYLQLKMKHSICDFYSWLSYLLLF